MKKLFALVLLLMMVLPAAVMAECVPSKTIDDMAVFEVMMQEEAAEETAVFILSVGEESEAYAEILADSKAELEKLAQSASAEAYFGEAKNAAGEVVSLCELLNTEDVTCFEFFPIAARGFKADHENVALKLQLATPYQRGEEVLVMIGFITEDGIEWIVYASSVDESGCVITEFDIETILRIQENNALMAVVSEKR